MEAKTIRNNTPLAYGFDSYNQAIMLECSQTLRLNIGDDNKAKALVPIRKDKMENGQIGNTHPCYSIDQGGGKPACVILADVSPTLTTTHYGAPAVCHEDTKMDYKKSIKTYQNTTGASGYSKLGTQEAMNDMFVVQPKSMAWDGSQISSTLTANNAAGEQHMPDKNNFNAVLNATEGENRMNNNNGYVVRRLTPLECERLQGYPDNFTNIPGASDTARYKALGNSIALPQWQIIIDNMAKYLPDGATLGSLFDGIGGFPLCWERTHGKGTARWASEIEKFPIEVTKYHFPE